MSIFFHDNPPGFFDSSTVIPPSGAVEISNIDRLEMHGHMTEGYSYLIKEGVVIRQEKSTPSSEQLEFVERLWRGGEIASTDWIISRHRDERDGGHETTITTEKLSELLSYRQELRDWPEHGEFPDASQRPQRPKWIAETEF